MKNSKQLVPLAMTCVLFFSKSVFAQQEGFHYGARFGIGESNIKIDGEGVEKSKLAFSVGATSTYQFNRFLGVSADFLFTSKGAKYHGSTTDPDFLGNPNQYEYDEIYKVFSGEIPLMLKLTVPLGEDFAIRAYGGPSMQFQLMGLQTREYANEDYDIDHGYMNQKMNSLETVEYGMVYGAGFEASAFDERTFFLDFRVNSSLTEIGRFYGKNAPSSYYMISIGYLF